MKLTKKDRALLDAFAKNGFINICRNKDGDLLFIVGNPYVYDNDYWGVEAIIDDETILDLDNSLFKFITFENSPWRDIDLDKLLDE